ncbi:MAG TPA: sigma-70 family RNA polymerase sigma factor [Humisphaera sp.]
MLSPDDRLQIESLYRRFGKGVGSYVLARTRDRELAESITAQVFLLVVRRWEQCHGNVVAWLWSIVRTELARHFRDRKVHEPIDAVEPPADRDDAADPAAAAERAEMSERMRQALDALGEPAHSLVHMKFFLDMSNVDIAEALGMTPSNVGVVAHRAVKRLKELVEGPRAAVPIAKVAVA